MQVDEAAAAAAQLAVVPDGGLAQGATAASLDGGLLIGPDANGDSGTPVQLQQRAAFTNSGQPMYS